MSALSVLYKSLYQALGDNTLWDDRVYPEIVPAKIVRPYVVFFALSGGETNKVQRDDADFTVVVKCVSLQLSESLDGAHRIGQILNNGGSQDGGDVVGDTDWVITTIQQTRIVRMTELINTDQPLYNNGHIFEIMMEKL